MQPITIEPLSYIALIIIIITLVYSFVSYRKKETKKDLPQAHQQTPRDDYERPALVAAIAMMMYRKKETKKDLPQAHPQTPRDDYERPALVAAIAMMMEGKTFIIKRVILTGKQEKASSWRQFGRQEIMRRRMNLQK